jgi:hypothetical protein
MLASTRSRKIYLAIALLSMLVLLVATVHGNLFTLYQVQSQDLPILLALPPMFAVLAYWSPGWKIPDRAPPKALIFVIGCFIVLLLGWSAHSVMGDFPLSRDEHMVVFDMAVFDRGRLAAPLSPVWRAYAEALVPAFLLNADNPVGLVSAYLPVNAMLRLAFSKIVDPVFFNPLLALIGGIAVWDIAKRQFKEDHRALWVVLLIYGLSSQMLITAMTTYSMTAHMALNMVWLAAFLRGGKSGHALAIAVGFLAAGLHQVVFHPLFAAPFILWRLRQREWRTVLLYGVAYAAIIGWWVSYPHIVALYTGVSVDAKDVQADFFSGRVLPLLTNRDPSTVPLMLLNLLRFVAWQNLALVPLCVAALPLAWRDKGLAGPLLWGIAGLLFFITVVLPYQGHGWGYRYLHPFLGSFALLAGFGYKRLVTQIGSRADGIVLLLSGLTLIFAFPLLLLRTYDFVEPHVALERYIARQKADFIVIDTEVSPSTDGRWAANAIDHVRNKPDLDNHPLRFSSRKMSAAMIAYLCRRGDVAIITRADMHENGFAMNLPTRSPTFERKIAPLSGRFCIGETKAS